MNLDKLVLPTGLSVNQDNLKDTDNNKDNVNVQLGSGPSNNSKYTIDNNNFISKQFSNVLQKIENDNILNLNNILEVLN